MAYGALVEQQMRLGFNTIKKLDFLLEAYPAACTEAFKTQNIQNSFIATGTNSSIRPRSGHPAAQYSARTPTPPTPAPRASRSSNSQSSWVLQTPSNPRQLHQQANNVKNLMGQGLGSPPHGLVEGLDQIIKACEYGMANATIMKKQYQDIFAANEKEKQKYTRFPRRARGLDYVK
ncbi:conserved hypothetical protein [Coccidioides posadasii str. Silveira]|uniref:Uncharacterized protein n=2 Tax=Coccidioides posadasii TaxID=199306 RepID=E9D356_COCPS|nr:conserved hypothetical protein [Coccidioides posadasii str. Silveira]KMM71396.1 hypothetical protein CPAG_07703 [Coccidioides posadasii RMSCC 3488]